MPTEDFAEALRYLKALADESRLRMLGLLALRERSVDELATLLDLRVPTVSHHLARLNALDLLERRVEGTSHYYRLRPRALSRVHALLATPERVAMLVGDDSTDVWERKVLRDFSEAGRLTEIPAQEKKRLVILRWLAEQFAWGRTYTEAEVNDLLTRYHPDCAVLRRELVGHQFLDRESGTYWRVHPLTAEDLQRLAAAFTWGRLYTLAETDELLRHESPEQSPATLRRRLLNADLLSTRQEMYWRTQPPLPES